MDPSVRDERVFAAIGASGSARDMSDESSSRDRAATWLPDFCSLPVIGAVMLVAELVVLVIVLSPSPQGMNVERLLVASVFGEWLALCCLVALCRMRPLWQRMRPAPGVVAALLAIGAIAALASVVVQLIDEGAGLGLTEQGEGPFGFAVSTTLITLLVAAVLLRYYYVRAQWQREIKAQAKAQVVALQARIRPHFLFNSMNTIASLIRTRPQEAERAVEDLSDLFRAALSAGEGMTTLGDELALVDRYLAIETLRVGERLRVERDTAALPADLPIPSLLLQPLVENAVLHGIQPLPEGGTIAIRGAASPERVSIAIHNPRPAVAPAYTRGNRTALENVRQRMRYHYGERGKLEVDAGAGYYAVVVSIPRE
jgi:two-component system, LytTR family, sensor histidine kinase AlgZ